MKRRKKGGERQRKRHSIQKTKKGKEMEERAFLICSSPSGLSLSFSIIKVSLMRASRDTNYVQSIFSVPPLSLTPKPSTDEDVRKIKGNQGSLDEALERNVNEKS